MPCFEYQSWSQLSIGPLRRCRRILMLWPEARSVCVGEKRKGRGVSRIKCSRIEYQCRVTSQTYMLFACVPGLGPNQGPNGSSSMSKPLQIHKSHNHAPRCKVFTKTLGSRSRKILGRLLQRPIWTWTMVMQNTHRINVQWRIIRAKRRRSYRAGINSALILS